jgi:hypothetical protein
VCVDLLILFGIRKNCHRSGRNLSLCLFIRREIKVTIVITEECHLPATYKVLPNILVSRLTPYVDEIIGDHQCDFNIIDKLLIRCFAFVRYWRKNGSVMRQYISHL